MEDVAKVTQLESVTRYVRGLHWLVQAAAHDHQ